MGSSFYRIVFGMAIYHISYCTELKWIKTRRKITHDDLFPGSAGLEPSTTGITRFECSRTCQFNRDCAGFVYVSSTSVCQLHQGTWLTTSALTTLSARFYRIVGRNAVTCLAGWEEFLGSCYLFDVANMHSSFNTASSICSAHGGYLTHANTDSENEFIKQRCAAVLDSNGNGVSGCWIGLSDSAVEGDWRWLDDGKSITWDDWHSGQPNEGTGANCVALYNVAGYDNMWTDEPCGYGYMPVCEIYMDE